jgi:hypothetical protein
LILLVPRSGPARHPQAGGFTYLGEATELHVLVGKQKIQAKGAPNMTLKPGAAVSLQIPVEDCLIIRSGEL